MNIFLFIFFLFGILRVEYYHLDSRSLWCGRARAQAADVHVQAADVRSCKELLLSPDPAVPPVPSLGDPVIPGSSLSAASGTRVLQGSSHDLHPSGAAQGARRAFIYLGGVN